jgi:putative ABC transport system ATP-binding protein
MGPSGSGKSTLMHLLGCLETPSSGTYLLEGLEVGKLSGGERAGVRNRRIGFVFQTFNLIHQLSAFGNVALPLMYGRRSTEPSDRVAEALEQVGLGHRGRHRPAELSGGERQRVAIARALVADPAIILADEPTGNLDSATGTGILALLDEQHRKGRTILIVTHDAQVASHAERTRHMRDGALVSEEASDVAT